MLFVQTDKESLIPNNLRTMTILNDTQVFLFSDTFVLFGHILNRVLNEKRRPKITTENVLSNTSKIDSNQKSRNSDRSRRTLTDGLQRDLRSWRSQYDFFRFRVLLIHKHIINSLIVQTRTCVVNSNCPF